MRTLPILLSEIPELVAIIAGADEAYSYDAKKDGSWKNFS